VKGASAFRVNREIQPKFRLRWQEGYGVLTLRKDEAPKVARYIDNQETHHRAGRLSTLLETTEGEVEDFSAATRFRPLKGRKTVSGRRRSQA
jgi:hypothetical protein